MYPLQAAPVSGGPVAGPEEVRVSANVLLLFSVDVAYSYSSPECRSSSAPPVRIDFGVVGGVIPRRTTPMR